jgi:hypothetical protein
VQRLKGVFSLVGASSEDIAPLSEDISNTFKHIENEVDALDEVIAGHGDFCALLASRGTAAAFLKVGCTHAKTVNRPTISLSPSDMIVLGEGKDATRRSRPSLQSLVRRRQNGQGHPSLDTTSDEGLRRGHPTVRPRPARRPTCDPAHCNRPCVAAACYEPNL